MKKELGFYESLRVSCSLLISEGHHGAWKYPIGFLLNETIIARARVDLQHRTAALLIYEATSSLMSKEAGEKFTKTLKSLT